jgi:hypothetical protein
VGKREMNILNGKETDNGSTVGKLLRQIQGIQ